MQRHRALTEALKTGKPIPLHGPTTTEVMKYRGKDGVPENIMDPLAIHESPAHRQVLKGIHLSYIKALTKDGALPADHIQHVIGATWTFGSRLGLHEGRENAYKDSLVVAYETLLDAIRGTRNQRVLRVVALGPSNRQGCYDHTAEVLPEIQDFQLAHVAKLDPFPDAVQLETNPSVAEAVAGVAAAKKYDVPVITSFVTAKNGLLRDGTPIPDAIAQVDDATGKFSHGFMVNCGSPQAVEHILASLNQHPNQAIKKRFIGFSPNADEGDPWELDGLHEDCNSEVIGLNDPQARAKQLVILAGEYPEIPIQILAGCCGTDPEFLAILVDEIVSTRQQVVKIIAPASQSEIEATA